jgi:hypothetical protein
VAEFNKEFLKLYKERMEGEVEPSLEGFLGGREHRIPGADMIDERKTTDYFPTPVFEYNPDPTAGIMAYSPQEKAEDKLLLRSLQRGDMGSGPNVDKAVQDLINRINGVRLRGA